jgi:hypothetical protein
MKLDLDVHIGMHLVCYFKTKCDNLLMNFLKIRSFISIWLTNVEVEFGERTGMSATAEAGDNSVL